MRYALIFLLLFPCALAEPATATQVTAFSSPESALGALAGFIASANTTLYINVYTLTSEEIAGLILKEVEEGTSVTLMVDGAPVGGLPEKERLLLGTLASHGVEVYLYDGPLRFNHAKYAVADNTSVLITTENFGASGFPPNGEGNRGWGAVIVSKGLAKELARLFFYDLRHADRFTGEGRMQLSAQEARPYAGVRYEGSFPVLAVVAPENAIDATLALLRSANRSIYIEQFYIYTYWGRAKEGSPATTPNLFLEEVINAARRGVEVKILLDSTWYNVKRDDPRSNLRTVQYVNEIARRENLPLEARLAKQDNRIRKYHIKGVVVDGRAVMFGSMNWNEHSPKKNREVSVIIYGEPARYFERLFLEDWERSGEGGTERQPWLVAALLALLFLALLLKRRAS